MIMIRHVIIPKQFSGGIPGSRLCEMLETQEDTRPVWAFHRDFKLANGGLHVLGEYGSTTALGLLGKHC